MKILVVEDHPVHLKLFHRVLSAAGHEVDDAAGAEDALGAVRRNRPEVVLVDLQLPGMDGLTLVRELRRDPQSRSLCVAAVTGFFERWSQRDALDAGCNAYFKKPINTRNFSDQLIEAARTQSEALPRSAGS